MKILIAIICLLFGGLVGVMFMALMQYKDFTIRKSAALIKTYCGNHSCLECRFHRSEYPYCEVNYPCFWMFKKEADDGE